MPPPDAEATPAAFEREYGCTVADWLRCLPGAAEPHALQLGEGEARIVIGSGTLALRWRPLPPRRIALVTLPRLQVGFAFDGLEAGGRSRFLQRFDLYMHRGGG